MSEDKKAEPIPALAEHWARKGADEVEKMDATINLARQLLVRGEVEPYGEGENPVELPTYHWESTETPIDGPRRIFRGTVTHLTTGSGQTVYFAACLARDEDEFRRKLAANLDRHSANAAHVVCGLGDMPFSEKFTSQSLRLRLEMYDIRKNAPAAFFYSAMWHENRS